MALALSVSVAGLLAVAVAVALRLRVALSPRRLAELVASAEPSLAQCRVWKSDVDQGLAHGLRPVGGSLMRL